MILIKVSSLSMILSYVEATEEINIFFANQSILVAWTNQSINTYTLNQLINTFAAWYRQKPPTQITKWLHVLYSVGP